MGTAHYFVIDSVANFLNHLEARRYSHEDDRNWTVYSKVLSDVLVKYYSFWLTPGAETPLRIRVTYNLINDAKPLRKLSDKLKALNWDYLRSLPIWKTKRQSRPQVRERRWKKVQNFLKKYGELISCFKYQADDRLTEGNHSFNLEMASNTREQAVCFDFIKAIAEAHGPQGIVRGHRQIDRPSQQRNGWIKRYAGEHRKRGWTSQEIAREIQKELREGTWNERSKLQYNLADNTICKIAGIKLAPTHLTN